MNETIIPGRTRVKVFKRKVNDFTGAESIEQIKTGVVLQEGSSFLRVFDARPVKEGGDANTISEWFPIKSKNIWVEFWDELPARNAITVPPSF